MHRKVQGLLAIVCIVSGSATVVLACKIPTTLDCCSIARVSLNMTRKCGLFNDQECPDRVVNNTGSVPTVVDAITGKQTQQFGESFVCSYETGRCTGSIGSNLCRHDPVANTSCTSSTPDGGDCSPPGSRGGRGDIHDHFQPY